jgi:hypothetical protein
MLTVFFKSFFAVFTHFIYLEFMYCRYMSKYYTFSAAEQSKKNVFMYFHKLWMIPEIVPSESHISELGVY